MRLYMFRMRILMVNIKLCIIPSSLDEFRRLVVHGKDNHQGKRASLRQKAKVATPR